MPGSKFIIYSMSKIIISANCQTAALTRAMRALLPNCEIIPFALHIEQSREMQSSLRQNLSDADFLMAVNHKAEIFKETENKDIKVVPIPLIHFEAFHPDITYALHLPSKTHTNFHYNSKIAVWCYNQDLSIKDTLKLFNSKFYRALGYFDCWLTAEKSLAHRFAECGFSPKDFSTFFSKIKRCGNFMYSINHPTSSVSVELAKMIVKKVFNNEVDVDREIIVEDSLTESIWPLYTEIGDELGLEGNYVWRIRNQEITGLEDYLNFAFLSYKKQKIKPGDLSMPNDKVAKGFNDSIYQLWKSL